MNLELEIWRQANRDAKGRFVTYSVSDVSPDMSFLEMLDVLNETLVERGEDPVAFDSDCREGICGACGLMINGLAHGPIPEMTTCQLHMRHFHDGQKIRIEPWRSRSFPVIKDLIVDRMPFDAIIQAGGFITANTGSAPEANETLIPKEVSDRAMDAAECIGCGACVAQCPNGAGQLFTAAKISHLALLPQGQPERYRRVAAMVETMESYFGTCTNFRECEAVCPKGISIDFIALMNRDFLKAALTKRGGSESS
ncbi:MAG TPA: succinate dehydrogenase/fumarate reductase iron-sulfur subunit [Thermoanaerobaculia bacterium]|nr:succinate dehydrogenase/fumarate reductase iron-sulfur subunit [Thermoanaerobaculia bacterium]